MRSRLHKLPSAAVHLSRQETILYLCLFLLLPVAVGFGASMDAVRRVDFRECPECRELADRARKLGNEVYPRVLALLADGTAKLPTQFDIVFKKEIIEANPDDFTDVAGYVRGRKGTTIFLNADWFTTRPTNFEAILVHEMAHVAQRYSSSAPQYWTEGMADYVAFKAGFPNSGTCPECTNLSWHYRSGYSCAAAFLLCLEATRGPNLIRDLNSSLRAKSYSDKFFTTATGKSLDELWTEFQKTSAFTPAAAKANRFFESLGYTNGVAPKGGDLVNLVKQQPGGNLTLEAQKFLYGLAKKHELPGFRPGESGNVVFALTSSAETEDDNYPIIRTFDSEIQGAPTIYHYVVVRTTRRSTWKLQAAWKSDRPGTVIEEFEAPH
jgi:hypothetical protein